MKLTDYSYPDRMALLGHWHIGEQQARRGRLGRMLALLRYMAVFEPRVDLNLVADLLGKVVKRKLGRPRKPTSAGPDRAAAEAEARMGNFRPIIELLLSLHARDLEANVERETELLPNYRFVASLLSGKSVRARGHAACNKIELALRNIQLRGEVEHRRRNRDISQSAAMRYVARKRYISEGSLKRAVYSISSKKGRKGKPSA